MTERSFFDGRAVMHNGDSRDVLRTIPDASIDAVVTDPPYALVSIVKRFGKPGAAPATDKRGESGPYMRASAGFMGQEWDTGETAFAAEFWAEVLRVLKPGGHVVAFGGTRTYHRLACAIEDAGFEIRDQLGWVYGTGFPKSHDVSKGIDKAAGATREVVGSKLGLPGYHLSPHKGGEALGAGLSSSTQETRAKSAEITAPATEAARQWEGWGTAIKPAWEPIVLARKPLIGTVVENVLAHGTGALNIGACRIGEAKRFPANVIHDGSPEVEDAFAEFGERTSGARKAGTYQPLGMYGNAIAERPGGMQREMPALQADAGSASRFFYSAKASKADRAGSKHPTVKPVDLMRWLCRLITPPGGVILEPFAGSGSTLQAAVEEGFRVVGVEREAAFFEDCCRRLSGLSGERKARVLKPRKPRLIAPPPAKPPTFIQPTFFEMTA